MQQPPNGYACLYTMHQYLVAVFCYGDKMLQEFHKKTPFGAECLHPLEIQPSHEWEGRKDLFIPLCRMSHPQVLFSFVPQRAEV